MLEFLHLPINFEFFQARRRLLFHVYKDDILKVGGPPREESYWGFLLAYTKKGWLVFWKMIKEFLLKHEIEEESSKVSLN